MEAQGVTKLIFDLRYTKSKESVLFRLEVDDGVVRRGPFKLVVFTRSASAMVVRGMSCCDTACMFFTEYCAVVRNHNASLSGGGDTVVEWTCFGSLRKFDAGLGDRRQAGTGR